MSLAVSSQPDNGFHFGHSPYASTPGHDLRPAPEPWAAVSAAIGQLGAQSFMPPLSTVAPNPHQLPRPIITRPVPTPTPAPAAGLQPGLGPPPVLPPIDAAFQTFPAPGGVPEGYSFIGELQSPLGYRQGSSINPNDLSSGQLQPRSVDVGISGDVAKYVSKLKDQEPPLRRIIEEEPLLHSISIVRGDSPVKGFSTDYAGWKEEPPDPKPQDPSVIKWTTLTRDPLRCEAPDPATFICQKCGLHWLGALVFEDRSENGKRKRQESRLATLQPDQPLKRPDMLQYRWCLVSSGTDPCIKGHTARGQVHPSYMPMDDEADCCPPSRHRPPSGLQCFFDNCPYVDKGPAELRKHLLKKHWTYLEDLINRIRDKRELSDCDRLVAHRAMFAYNGLDNAGKIKVSEPRLRVLSPEQISVMARYEEHAEWIEFLDRPKMEKWVDYHQENGQIWIKTYSMDPIGGRSEQAKLERYDPVTGELHPAVKKKRRRLSSK